MSFESRIIGSFLFWNTFVWNNFIIWNIYKQVIHHISALQYFLYHFICCTTIFFLSGFSFTDIDNSQDSRGREGTIFYSTLPLPPAHEHSDNYLQLCAWDDYYIFLIAPLVFTRLQLDGLELASTFTLLLQANRLTKCASHPKYYWYDYW